MKKAFFVLIVITFLSCKTGQNAWIRINQLGYRPGDIKTAILISINNLNLKNFRIIDAESGKTISKFEKLTRYQDFYQFKTCYRLDFSDFTSEGEFRIKAGRFVSPVFSINKNIYKGTADFILNYMRQQRCGFNPFLNDSCHMYDGYEMYGKGDSAHIDARGGWHDAADYLQYVTTSANSVYQMLFAFSQNPGIFQDNYIENGMPGNDSIPDILDECMWGIEWLLRMNPGKNIMYNQVADDRDHIGFRLPVGDTAYYGKGKERPVYRCTGSPQGLFGNMNRSTGIASTAGKFASAFALASRVYHDESPAFAEMLLRKAADAFDYGMKNPGVCQTAPGRAPYFYEEENWTDDMELAAIELFNATKDSKYLDFALKYGSKEPVTPWMGSDTARHYQWYPFVNMGHPEIAKSNIGNVEFTGYMKKGLELIREKADKNPFNIGVPFIWCSNNLITAVLTQAHLYAEISGDKSFEYMEAAHRDWLFGCNPWGTSMIVGIPINGDYPQHSHSSYVAFGRQVPGGLVDGPVYPSIFRSHGKYIKMTEPDDYEKFQTGMAVYHDNIGDYTSNECTMDGTASLTYYLSEMESY